MESQRFDQLTRGLATRGNRRSLLRGLTGITAASMAALGLGHEARFARALQNATSTEEQSVLLFEEMAGIAANHAGICDELKGKLYQFGLDHAEMMAAHKAEQDAWDRDKREQHAETYGDRRNEASTTFLAAWGRCEFALPNPATSTPPATPAARGWQPIATPVTSPGTEQPGAQSPSCNGQVKVACHNPSTGFQTGYNSVPAPCDQYLCHAPCIDATYCATTYPDVCSLNQCEVVVNVTDDACTGQSTFACVNANNGLSSPTFLASGVCDDESCQPCVGESYCSATYPDICPPGLCTISDMQATPPDCCHQNCPLSTSDCAYSVISGLGSDSDCMRCQMTWCGSTTECLKYCESSSCCDTPCSSFTNPDSEPHGE